MSRKCRVPEDTCPPAESRARSPGEAGSGACGRAFGSALVPGASSLSFRGLPPGIEGQSQDLHCWKIR